MQTEQRTEKYSPYEIISELIQVKHSNNESSKKEKQKKVGEKNTRFTGQLLRNQNYPYLKWTRHCSK